MQIPQSPQEHPFLTAVRLAARVGAPSFYADPDLAEPVVVLPLRQYRELVGLGVGEGVGSKAEDIRPPVVAATPMAPEPDSEMLFDPQAIERVIAQGEQEFAKKPRNLGSWQPIAERPPAAPGGEEGFYMQPVPRRQGF
jgi:hypothetical protein